MSDTNEGAQQNEIITERTERTVEPANQNDQQPQGFGDLAAANAEITRLRSEAARRRTERNEARDKVQTLEQQVQTNEQTAHRLARLEAAAKAGVSLEQLEAAEQLAAATSAEEITAAQERLNRATTQPPSTARNPTPPRTPTQPPSRDEQIIAAQNDGNYREAMRLKAEELTDLGT